jgi:uncharacterized delta-60 repeat protein
MIRVLASACLGLVASLCIGAPGDLDPDFGVEGVVRLRLEPGREQARSLHVTPTGQILAVGMSYNSNFDWEFVVARHHASGALDTSFGYGGRVYVPFVYGTADLANASVMQPDGKLVVTGRASSDVQLVRLLPDGQLDPGFGIDGVAGVDPGPYGVATPHALALQPDGKLIAGGWVYTGPTEVFMLVRFHANGALDTAFGTGGVATANVAGTVRAIVVQPDGKLVAAGSAGLTTARDIALARFNADGSPDVSFGNGGIVLRAIGPADDFASALAIQPDGRLVAAGHTDDGGFVLVRLLADGSPDSTFGNAGTVITNFGVGPRNGYARALTLQADGRLLAAGVRESGLPLDLDVAVARYLPDGALDPSFGSGGQVITSVAGQSEEAYALALRADGTILAAGQCGEIGGSSYNIFIVRYLAAGTLDPAFGSGGLLTVPATGAIPSFDSVAIQDDGKIVAGTGLRFESTTGLAVARLLPGGQSDLAFGNGGVARISTTGTTYPAILALRTDGRIVIASGLFDTMQSNWKVALYRLQSDGSPDPAFGVNGVQTVDLGQTSVTPQALAIDASGRNIVAGTTVAITDSIVLVVTTSAGSPDATFGTGGVVTTPIGPNGGGAYAVTVAPDSRIVVAGYAEDTGVAVVRYLANGALDTSFGGTGVVVVPLGNCASGFGGCIATAVLIQPDGRIVVAGSRTGNAFMLLRFLANGALDPSFGNGGVVLTSVGSAGAYAESMVRQPDGKLVVAGTSWAAGSGYDFTLVRYLANGSVDTTFGHAGVITTPISKVDDYAYALAHQPDGMLVAAGNKGAIVRFDGREASTLVLTRTAGTNPSIRGTPVTFTASVTGSAPTGLVTFMAEGAPLADCAAVTLAGSGDTRSAQCTTTALSVGAHLLAADYTGDAQNVGSTSAPLAHAVVAAVTGLRHRDFDGDGRDDLLWQSYYYGGGAVWLMVATEPVNGAWIGPTADWIATHAADLSGDGTHDLVVYNRHDGTTGVRLMNGIVQFASSSLLRDVNVRVTHTGDFDADGRSDLLWRDSFTGITALWLMHGTGAVATSWLLGEPAWVATHVADFDGDRRSDIVWRNDSTGETAIWLMNGIAFRSGAIVLSNAPWRVSMVGDFDGNGKSDLVWRNAGTGETAIWLMDGASMATGAIVVTSNDWVPTHVADLDGDRRSDILWRNSATGATHAWLMSGLGMHAGGSITVAGSEVVAIADYDGDGRDDIVWHDAATGITSMRLMQGLVAKGSAALLQSGDWHVVP